MSTVTASDGTQLAVRTWGSPDDPAVVLVHGLGLSARSFGEVPERLAEQHRVVAYDLRGHGDSSGAAGGDYSLEAHAGDLVAVLRETVPEGGGAVVVGNSLGGGIVLAAARDWDPSRVSGVVFAGSGGSGVTVPGLPARGVPDAVSALVMKGWLQVLRVTSLAAKDVRHVRPLADWLVRRAAFHSDSPDAAVTRVREDFFATRRQALARTTLASVSHNGVRLASHLEVPVLVLHGDRDPEVPTEEVHRLVEALPDAQLVTLPGAGHMLPLTRTDEVVEHVRRWSRQVGPRHAAAT